MRIIVKLYAALVAKRRPLGSANAATPTPRLAYVVNNGSNQISVYRIDPHTGTLVSVDPPLATESGPHSVNVPPPGRFAFVANPVSGRVSVYAIDPDTGALTNPEATASRGKSHLGHHRNKQDTVTKLLDTLDRRSQHPGRQNCQYWQNRLTKPNDPALTKQAIHRDVEI